MEKKSPKFDMGHLTLFGVGALVGAWWVRDKADSAKKSRVERDHPELVPEVCESVITALNDLELSGEFEDEDDIRDEVAKYLAKETDLQVEVAPPTPHGAPDLLIEGVLALELKILRTKADVDRAIGQCAGYVRDWVTWIVAFESPLSRVRALEQLLKDHGLERILVIEFEDDDDEGDDDDDGDDDGDDDDNYYSEDDDDDE